jgi:hypothetical protein
MLKWLENWLFGETKSEGFLATDETSRKCFVPACTPAVSATTGPIDAGLQARSDMW